MDAALILLIIFFIALIFSMFGMGGGLLYMPVFLFFLKDPSSASFLSFLCIFITASSAAHAYYRRGLIDGRLVLYLGLPLVVIVFASGLAVRSASRIFLKDFLGATLILAGLFMTFPIKDLLGFHRAGEVLHKRFPDPQHYFSPAILAPLILLIGLLSGMSGVAGGVFEIPVMAGLLRVSPHIAVATSSAIVAAVSLAGAAGRWLFNPTDITANIPLMIAAMVCASAGGHLGPRISTRCDKQVFKKLCGLFILCVGSFVLWVR